MYAAELLVKVVCAGMLASLCDDTDRHRYRLAHRLIRADGVGEWAATLDEILIGPAAQSISEEARTEQRELTQKCNPGDWQYDSVICLDSCLRTLDKQREGFPFKLEGKRWFLLFTELRNRTRAHGATSPSLCSQICPHLEKPIRLVIENFSLLKREWAYLHRNLSGTRELGDASLDFSREHGAGTGSNKQNCDFPAFPENDFEPLLTAEEAAAHLRIHTKTLQKLARQGQVPCMRPGKYWLFRLSSLDVWLRAQENHCSQPFCVK